MGPAKARSRGGRKPFWGTGALGSRDDTKEIRSLYQRPVEAGEIIFDAGDSGDRFFVIQSGEVEMTRVVGGGHRVVARLGAGEFFGELGAVLGERRGDRAVALEDTTLLDLDGPTLEDMCRSEPEIAIRMIRVLVARLIESERRLAASGSQGSLRPVVRTLVRRAEPSDKWGLRIPLDLRGLAEASSLTLYEAHRALHQLLDRKLVQLIDDTLYTPDLDALTACLDEPDPANAR